MAKITVSSYDGISLATSSFSAFMLVPEGPLKRPSGVVLSRPFGKHPRVVADQPLDATMPIHVNILSGDLVTQQIALAAVFVPGKLATLRVDFGESEVRKVDAVVERIAPFDARTNQFTAILRMPDPRWRSDTLKSVGVTLSQIAAGHVTDDMRDANVQGDGLDVDGSIGIYQGTTNLCTNGGFETNTMGWITGGTNTIAQDATAWKFGAGSAKVTYQDSTTLAAFNFSATASTYAVSAWVYVPADWDGGNLIVSSVNYVGATNTTKVNSAGIKGRWIRIWSRVAVVAGDLEGLMTLTTDSAPTAGKHIFFDGYQIEISETPTAYLETDGSTTTRTAATLSMGGGKLDPNEGWIAGRIRAGWSNADITGNRLLVSWRIDATNLIQIRYSASSGAFEMVRQSGGVGLPATVLKTVSAGVTYRFAAQWTATEVKLSINDSTFATSSNTAIPSLGTSQSIEIGGRGTSEMLDGDVFWMQAGVGTLTDAQKTTLQTVPSFKNKARWTADLSRTVWKKTGVTVTHDDRTEEGFGSLDKLVFSDALTTRRIEQRLINQTWAAADNWTASFAVVADTPTEIVLRVGSWDFAQATTKTVVVGRAPLRVEVTHAFTSTGTGIGFAVDMPNPKGGTVWAGQSQFEAAAAATAPQTMVVPGTSTGPTLGVSLTGADARFGVSGTTPPIVNPFPPDGDLPTGTVGFTPDNQGNAKEDALVLRITPIQQKLKADWWTQTLDSVIANRVTRALNDYAVEITGFAWDHASLVTSGLSQADGDDVRALVDGIEVPRWPGEGAGKTWNTSTTAIWINADYAPGVSVTLKAQLLSTTTTVGTFIEFDFNEAIPLPPNGFLLFDDEVIEYEGKTSNGVFLKGRAKRNTTAATHAAATVGWWVEHRVQLKFGYDAATAPAAHDERKPMIDLSGSTNGLMRWSTAFQNRLQPRSMQWNDVLLLRDKQSDKMGVLVDNTVGLPSVVDADGNLTMMRTYYNHDVASSEYKPGNTWRRSFPIRASAVLWTSGQSGFDLRQEMRGIDQLGKEFLVTGDAGTGSNVLLNGRATELFFYTRSYRVVDDPFHGFGTNIGVQDDTAIAQSASAVESFTVPEILNPNARLDEIELSVRVNSGQATARVSLAIEDPATPGAYIIITGTVDQTITSTIGTLARFDVSTLGMPALRPGQTIWISLQHIAQTATTLTWTGGKILYDGRSKAQLFVVRAKDLDIGDFALAGDGSFYTTATSSTVMDVTLNGNDALYVKLVGFGASRYHMKGQVFNPSTQQGIDIDLQLDAATGNTVLIDVKNRTVTEEQTGRNLLYGVSFTDPDRWMDIIPGPNLMTFTDVGLVEVDIDAQYSHVWN